MTLPNTGGDVNLYHGVVRESMRISDGLCRSPSASLLEETSTVVNFLGGRARDANTLSFSTPAGNTSIDRVYNY